MSVIQIIIWLLLGVCIAFIRNMFYMMHWKSPVLAVALLLGITATFFLKKQGNNKLRAIGVGILLGFVALNLPGSGLDNFFVVQSFFLLLGCLIGAFYHSRKVLVFTGLVALISILFYSVVFQFNQNKHDYNVKINDHVFEFVNGGYNFFPRNDGKVKLVELWFVDCAPCRAQLTYMKKFKKDYNNHPNIEFVTFNVSQADSKKRILSLIEDLSINISVGRDTSDYFEKITGLSGYPQFLVIDRNNRLRYVYHGFQDETKWMYQFWLRNTISKLESEPLDHSEEE